MGSNPTLSSIKSARFPSLNQNGYTYINKSPSARVFIIFFTFALFASGIFVNKILLTIIPPVLFVGIRMLSAGIILLSYTWKKRTYTLAQLKEDWRFLTGIAFFTTYTPSILKNYALKNLETGHATLLGSIDPFVTALYAYLLFGEKLTRNKIIGILIACAGVLFSVNLSNVGTKTCTGPLLLPQAAALCAVLFSRFGWIMVQHQLRKNRYPPAQLNGLIMTQSGIIALLTSAWLDTPSPLVISSPSLFWLLLTYTIIAGNVIAYTLYASLLKHHSATLISLSGFSIPIFAGLLGWAFLGEKLTLQFALAASVFFVGLLTFYADEIKRQKMA